MVSNPLSRLITFDSHETDMENHCIFITFNLKATTVEGAINYLASYQCVISNWDESVTFFDSLGLYKKGGVGFDRSIYNDLWNGPDTFRKDISGKRLAIQYPKLNMSVCGLFKNFYNYQFTLHLSGRD